MDRRTIIRTAAGTLVAALLSARGQQPDKVWRIGILDPGTPLSYAAFREGMRDLGYIDGRNIKYEIKDAQGGAADAQQGRHAQRSQRGSNVCDRDPHCRAAAGVTTP